MAGGEFDAVLFDLGGVLLQFGGIQGMRELAGIESDEELWRRWLSCAWVRRFESGRCDAVEFAAGVVADWGLSADATQFLDEFISWPRGPFEGAVELVSEASPTRGGVDDLTGLAIAGCAGRSGQVETRLDASLDHAVVVA